MKRMSPAYSRLQGIDDQSNLRRYQNSATQRAATHGSVPAARTDRLLWIPDAQSVVLTFIMVLRLYN